MREAKRIISAILVAALLVSTLAIGMPMTASAAGSFASVGGWNETIYAKISGISDSDVTGVSYSGPTSGSLTGEDLQYLVREEGGYTRIDVLGLKAGTYTLTVTTKSGTLTKSGIKVEAQDRSGYAHFNYTQGVGAYNDDGTLKSNAIVLYVTDSNKNSVTVTSKDGTTVTGIGNILGSTGMDVGGGLNSKGGKANTNQDILRKLAADGTPLVVRLIGNVTAPEGLTAYDSIDYGGTEGDNGFMARMSGGKDITIEGVGSEATMNGWGLHFICQTADYALGYGKSFEVRNLTFKNVPEDCVGMEGQQEGSTLTAPVERCWIHHCSFYGPTISNPAESDKDGGDGACDFKRGNYFTNSYCYYEGYHKTNLVGSSDSSLQYHLTYHHNYWKNCESRGPLARQADIHMYNNIFEGQSSYCMSLRANAYIFSEYNMFINCKNVSEGKNGGVCKSYNNSFTASTGADASDIVHVTDKSKTVSSDCLYANFDTNASVSYIPSGDYELQESITEMKKVVMAQAGAQPATVVSPEDVDISVIPADRKPTAAVVLPYNKDLNKTYITNKNGVYDNIVFNVNKTDTANVTVGGQVTGCDIVFYVNTTVNISMTEISGTYSPVLCNEAGEAIITGTGSAEKLPAGYYFIQSTYDPGSAKYKEAKVSHLTIEAVITHGANDHTYTSVVTPPTCTEGGYTTYTCECGDSYTGNETPAAGHKPGAAATCTEPQTCTVCGDMVKAANGHSYANGSCTVCGAIDPATCKHTNSSSAVTAPSCTKDGYTTYTCADCGYSWTGNTVAATGHKPGAAATCTTAQTCTVCGETVVAALGHSYADGVCSVCGQEDPLASGYIHSFDDGLPAAGSFYSASGDLSGSKGTVTYNGITVAQCMKVSSSASVSFTAPQNGTVTLVFNPSNSGYTIYINGGNSTAIPSDGIVTIDVTANTSYTITKNKSESFLYYIEYTPESSGGNGGSTEPTTPTEPEVPTTPTEPEVTEPSTPTEPDVTEPSVPVDPQPPVTGSQYIHNFTDDGFTSSFFTFAGGQITNGKHGTYTYDFGNGTETLNDALKFDSGGSVTFTPTADGTVTIAVGSQSAGRKVVINNGSSNIGEVSIDTANKLFVLTVDVSANVTYTVKRSSGESGLYYIAYTSAGAGHNHSYTAVVTAPTCTEAGYTTYTCACGDSYQADQVAALGHSYSNGICTVCGALDPNSGSHNHSYTAVVTAPTCTAAGYTTYTCACGDSYQADQVAALGHKYTSKVTEATCTEAGYTTHTCGTCGDTYKDANVPALGHKYANGVCELCGKTETAVEIKAFGHLESAYAEWDFVDGATGYNVYVQASGASGWTQLDDMLIRQYSDHMRADAVGLKAGKYVLKVVPLVNSTEQADQAMITEPVTVLAHDRSGYGFSASSTFKSASGAYNDDGTLKKDAQVIYVTADTAKTCTATVNGTVVTGFQSILDAKQKSGTTEPLCFRVVGLVTKNDLDHISSSSEGLQIKGKSSYNEMNITIEGIGEDAAFSGFGMLIRNCGNVEIRNLGILNFMDDGISVDTNNCNLWVHNCDFFYGGAGSDADQAKGDGSLDTKKSQYISYSYNHFWDSGKVHLVGNGTDSVNYLTFHHNWYDHADSRMPRVRSATVHVYNNFYDGVSKYGIGATMDSDIFSEANYFLNTRFPMLISNQGSDVYDPLTGAYDGEGTFSGETGGMIKSYADVIINAERFVPNSENATQFDAVVVENRNDTVSGVSAFDGGAGYNNFDTASGFYAYEAQSAADAMQTTKDYAGRINGGDLKFTFTDADNSDFDVDTEMKAAITGYKSPVVSIGGNSVDTGASGGGTEGGDSTEPTNPDEGDDPVIPAGSYVHDFTANGKESTFFSITGNLSTDKGTVSYNGLTLTRCLKIESSTNISFTAPTAGTLTLVFVEASPNIKVDGTKVTGSNGIITVDVAAGSHTITKADTMNLFYMVYASESAGGEEEHVHSYSGVVTAPTCTAGGFTIFTCTGCGSSYKGAFTSATGHSYTNGVCTICGEADPSYVGLFDLAGANMALGNSLSMYLYVNASDVAVGDYYIEIVKTYADGRDDVVKTVPMSEWTPYATMYYVSFDGVAAKEMTDDFHVTVYHADGTQASNTRTISIEAYAIGMLNRTDATSAATHNLMADMLNYGAAAQQSFKYAQNKLANANMTAAHKACGTQNFSMDQFSDNTVKGTGFMGANLSLESSICMYLYFDQNVVDNTMTARVSYTNHDEKKVSYEIPGSEFSVLGGYGFYGVEITTMAAADAESMVTVEILDGSTVVASGSTSVESLAARGYTGVPLYVDLMKFCTAAYNYFH